MSIANIMKFGKTYYHFHHNAGAPFIFPELAKRYK